MAINYAEYIYDCAWLPFYLRIDAPLECDLSVANFYVGFTPRWGNHGLVKTYARRDRSWGIWWNLSSLRPVLAASVRWQTLLGMASQPQQRPYCDRSGQW